MKQASAVTGRTVNVEANALADYYHLAKIGGVDISGVLGIWAWLANQFHG